MDITALREAVRREPFLPFTLRLTDGRSIAVRHPEFVAVGNRRVIVIHEDDSSSMLEPLLIVSLDYTPEPTKTGDQNGAG